MGPFARKPFNPQRILCPGPCTTTSGPAGVVDEVLWSQIRFSANVHKYSVFVHRFEPYGFGISTPISHNFMIPTIRQCFVAMALFASKNRTFIEPPDFSPEQPRIPPDPFTYASARPTPRRNKNFGQKKGTLDESIGSQSIIYGGDINIATSFVNCKRLILGSNHKVYEVIWESQPAIDKCRSHVPNYAHEARAYEDIHTKGPQGYSLFSMMLHS